MHIDIEAGHIQQNISVTKPVRKKVSTDQLQETTYLRKR